MYLFRCEFCNEKADEIIYPFPQDLGMHVLVLILECVCLNVEIYLIINYNPLLREASTFTAVSDKEADSKF